MMRYRVEKANPYGYAIVDRTGRDEPYLICFARCTLDALEDIEEMSCSDAEFELATSFKRLETGKHGKSAYRYVHCCDPAYMTPEAHDLKTAQGWCEIWNLVASGCCGSCKKRFVEGEGRYPAVSNRLCKVICFACACSQWDEKDGLLGNDPIGQGLLSVW